ncbi:hypothetical protein SAMN06265337_0625 [Hymenobacter gelipurpurascens]|uniref:PKD/Chitinase domain-containing protein n=1 Tax=Hymenobacter gelipurpurascens TaxID=89968 RepID=A0A212T850_9BACT|nr:SGNH/GDSL hydrolase family protein [Hymenobacter gelipurpurascens]SNC62212.1 hypothetical protein SAMN06265337_0625 [Hymenobacter gelipurpurascens]
MAEFLEQLDAWPLGTPLPKDAIFMMGSASLQNQFRIDASQLPTAAAATSTALYVRKTRAEMVALQQEDKLQIGVTYLVSGRTAGRPPIAVQAIDTDQISPFAARLEADGTVSACVYSLADDTDSLWTNAGLTATSLKGLLEQGTGIDIAVVGGKVRISGQTVSQPVAPRNPRTDDVANIFYHDLVVGFPSPSDYELEKSAEEAGYSVHADAYVQDGKVYFPGMSGPHPAGSVRSRVVASGNRPAGMSVANLVAFTGPVVVVVPGPTLTQAQPASGLVGAQVILTGTNLTGAIVAFNGTAAAPVSITATQIVVPVPAGATSGNITATTNAGTATLYFTVTAPAANVLPVANAGSATSITLPTNSVVLNGAGTDADGTITGYLWEQTIGPNQATGLPSTQAQIVAGALVQGTYQFKLTVTDNKGGTGTSTVQITVNAATVTGNAFKTGVSGDSIMTNNYGTPGTPTLIQQHYAGLPEYKGMIANYSQNGHTIQQQIDALAAAPFAYDSTVDTFWLVEVLVNDCGQYATDTTTPTATILTNIQNKLIALHQAIRARGPRVKTIACTALSVGIIVGQTYPESVRQRQQELVQRMNAWIRLNFRTALGAECLADRQSDFAFDTLEDTSNTTYYQDNVHPTQAGRERDAPICWGAIDAARNGLHVIVEGQRDSSVNLNYSTVAVQENYRIVESENLGEWEFPAGTGAAGDQGVGTTYYDGYAGSKAGAFTNTAGVIWQLTETCSRVQIGALRGANTGIWRLRISRTSDGGIVYNQTRSQADSTTAYNTTTSLTSDFFLDSGDLPMASYRIEMVAESKPVSFDFARLKVGAGSVTPPAETGVPAGFTGIVAPLSIEDSDSRVVYTVTNAPDGGWLTYPTGQGSAGAIKYSSPGNGTCIDAAYSSTNGGQFYGQGVRIKTPTAGGGAAFEVLIDGVVRAEGTCDNPDGVLTASAVRATATAVNGVGVHTWQVRIKASAYSFSQSNLFCDVVEFF